MPRRIKTAQAEKAESDPFLKEARDRFKYIVESWRDIREEHDKDQRFRSGDQWDETEKRRRKDKALPMITVDLIGQYVNELIGDIRQNKRAVNVLPKGYGATEKSANFLADWVRATEYLSQGQTAYIGAAEQMIGSSYGFCKLETYFESPKSWNMGVKILPIPNGNTILYDPDCKHYDCSDAEDCFEIDFISHDKFRRMYGDAEIKTFAEDIQQIAPDWVKPKQVQVASWWRVKTRKVTLYLVKGPDGSQQLRVMRSDQLPKNFDRSSILKEREHEERRIVQYILNGVEVLEANDPDEGKGWPGQWIPIIPFWGPELFVDEGSGSRRILLSMIRKARDPQRVFNYIASQEMMETKLSPRTPYMGPKGMFHQGWDDVNETPRAWIDYNVPEGYQPGQVKPERVPFVPNLQQYEATMQGWERRIMSSMGISPLPSAAQRNNEKSGVALEKIQGERAQATYQFIDNIERSIAFCGRQLVDVFDKINTMARDIPIRKEDGRHSVVRVNDPSHPKNQTFDGEHDVTVTTGPSYDSQRQEAAAFADTLASIPGVFPLIGDLIVKLRNVGPIGELIAERLTPPQFAGQGDDSDLSPQARTLLGQAHQKIQQLTTLLQQMSQEKAAKMIEKSVALEQTALQEKTKLIIAQATLNRDQAESILESQLASVDEILSQIHEHAVIAHQAEQDRATAAHAASIAPPPAPAGSSNGQQ
jgi:hypothetical protein